jgi:hypothetical protein
MFQKKDYLSDFMEANYVATNKKLLIWDLGGFDLILRKNAILGTAMRFRGYEPYCIICNGISGACIQRGLELKQTMDEWPNQCRDCYRKSQQMAKEWGISILSITDYVKSREIKQLRQITNSISVDKILHYTYLGVNVGELAFSSFNRYMKGYIVDPSDVENSSHVEVYRQYFFGSLVNTLLADRVLSRLQPNAVLTSHGVYSDYAPIVFTAKNRNIPVLSWSSGFKPYCHYFDIPKDCSHLQLRGVSEEKWKEEIKHRLTEKENKRLDDFFRKRYFSNEARDIKVSVVHKSCDELKKELSITKDKVVCLFCHVNWDACFDMSNMAFESANQWVVESIKKMCTIPDVDWIVRVHPGEFVDGTLYSTYDVIRDNFDLSKLPSNVKILSHGSTINTYDLFQLIDCGITVLGSVGAELPCFGKPIIAAGEAHFSGKGFSYDAKTRGDYFRLLKNIPSALPEKQIELARRYAYLYFIQRQVPFTFINKNEGHWGNIDYNKLSELLPGRNLIVDKVCNCIAHGEEVILHDRELEYIGQFGD